MLGRAIAALRARVLREERRRAPAAAVASEPQAPSADELAAEARASALLEAAAIVVDVAIAQWRLLPALRKWAIDYAAHDPAGFAAFLVSAPVIPSSALVPPHAAALSPIRPRLH